MKRAIDILTCIRIAAVRAAATIGLSCVGVQAEITVIKLKSQEPVLYWSNRVSRYNLISAKHLLSLTTANIFKLAHGNAWFLLIHAPSSPPLKI